MPGGTATRIVFKNTRFSEDLDFDNIGLSREEFEKLSMLIKRNIKLEGYEVEIKNKFKVAYTIEIKILKILFNYKVSTNSKEKLLIKINAEQQGFDYKYKKDILNKFDVFLRINVVPLDILLSQKLYAIFNRPRTMGRDFYDAVFLLGRTKPNYRYLKQKIRIDTKKVLRTKLLNKCKGLDFKKLAKDVEPFLFTPSDSKKVLHFYEYIRNQGL